ncbi:hypothetical protein BDV11DRAFT_77001 [Aspergillus similis]
MSIVFPGLVLHQACPRHVNYLHIQLFWIESGNHDEFPPLAMYTSKRMASESRAPKNDVPDDASRPSRYKAVRRKPVGF